MHPANPDSERWIPVTERLPDADQSVLICTASDVVEPGFLDDPDWRWINGSPVDEPVDFWRDYPLPPDRSP